MRTKLEIEADHAKGACEMALEDLAELERWWPKNKRGSNARNIFDRALQRIAGVRDCLTDGLTDEVQK